MIATPRRMRWTEEEYLARENESPSKHEFFDGEVFAMAGTSPLHNQVAANANGVLHNLLRGRPCRTFNSDQRIYIPATGLCTYPDGGVACGKWQIHSDGMCLLNPVLLYEVLSPATREYDRGYKREHYQQIPSLRHILVLDQPTRLVEHYHREPGGAWDFTHLSDGAVRLPDLGGVILLEELYLSDGP